MIDMNKQENRMLQIIRYLRTTDIDDVCQFINKNHEYYKTTELANVIKELLTAVNKNSNWRETENIMYDAAEWLGERYDIYDV